MRELSGNFFGYCLMYCTLFCNQSAMNLLFPFRVNCLDLLLMHQLKPRSAQAGTTSSNTSGSGSRRSANLFGAAKPREEVLAKKGIDAKLMDERIQKKVAPVRFTKVSL